MTKSYFREVVKTTPCVGDNYNFVFVPRLWGCSPLPRNLQFTQQQLWALRYIYHEWWGWSAASSRGSDVSKHDCSTAAAEDEDDASRCDVIAAHPGHLLLHRMGSCWRFVMFYSCGFFFLTSSFIFSSPILTGRRLLDAYRTSTRDLALSRGPCYNKIILNNFNVLF